MRSNYLEDEYCHVTRREFYSALDGTYYVDEQPHTPIYRHNEQELRELWARKRVFAFQRLGRYLLQGGNISERMWHYVLEDTKHDYDKDEYERFKSSEHFETEQYEEGKAYYLGRVRFEGFVSKFVPKD